MTFYDFEVSLREWENVITTSPNVFYVFFHQEPFIVNEKTTKIKKKTQKNQPEYDKSLPTKRYLNNLKNIQNTL